MTKSGRRDETHGMNTVGQKRRIEERQGFLCGVLWLCRMKGSPGKENVCTLRCSCEGDTSLAITHNTLDWTSFSRPLQVSSGRNAGSSAALKEVFVRPLGWWRRNMAGTGLWIVHHLWSQKTLWTTQTNSEQCLGSSNECREEDSDSPAEVWLLSLLADQTRRLLMMKKVAGVCVCANCTWWGSRLLWNVTVREITHAGNSIEVVWQKQYLLN